MLSINGLHNFYYLPELHDMRCKAQRICEIIRGRYHRDPLNGDVYMFMSKDQRKVRMIHYERNAYYLHEKSFIKGYKFMKIERKNDVTVYKIDWKDRKHSVNHVFSSPTSIINFTSKKPSYDDTRRSGRDNELLQRAQNDL